MDSITTSYAPQSINWPGLISLGCYLFAFTLLASLIFNCLKLRMNKSNEGLLRNALFIHQRFFIPWALLFFLSISNNYPNLTLNIIESKTAVFFVFLSLSFFCFMIYHFKNNYPKRKAILHAFVFEPLYFLSISILVIFLFIIFGYASYTLDYQNISAEIFMLFIMSYSGTIFSLMYFFSYKKMPSKDRQYFYSMSLLATIFLSAPFIWEYYTT